MLDLKEEHKQQYMEKVQGMAKSIGFMVCILPQIMLSMVLVSRAI